MLQLVVHMYGYRAGVPNVYAGTRFRERDNDFSRNPWHSKPVISRPKTYTSMELGVTQKAGDEQWT